MLSAEAGMRRYAGAALLLGTVLSLLASTAVRGQETDGGAWDPSVEKRWTRRPPSLGIENGYRDTLAAWARGVDGAVERYGAFQVQVVEGIIGTEVSPTNLRYDETGRALSCLASIERNTLRLLRLDDPEVLPVAYAFQLMVYLDVLERPRQVWLAELEWERLDDIWRAFRGREAAPPKGSDEMLALLFVETGARLEELGLIGQLGRAREVFERAVDHSPDNVAARYRAGFLAEKLGLYRRAHRQFDWLVERRPVDHEVRLRRALIAARLGPAEAGVEDLEELTVSGGERWIRSLAFQELARSLAAEDPAAAIEVLRRGHAALPEEQEIEIQLAYRLGPGSDEGRQLLRDIVGREAGRADASSRGRYEEGRKKELRAEQERFTAELVPRRGRLVEALDRIERFETTQDAYRRHRGADPDPVREVFFECRGYKPPDSDRRGRDPSASGEG